MAEPQRNMFCTQLKAMLKRNFILKKREKRKTIVEITFPMYFLAILILLKLGIPNSKIGEIREPRGEENLFKYFSSSFSHTVAVVPNSTEVTTFLGQVNSYRKSILPDSNFINWETYETEDDLMRKYNKSSNSIPIAVVFDNSDPLSSPLRYDIRTNPSFTGTPSSGSESSSLSCRGGTNPKSSLEKASTCPVNSYYFSGFLAIQTLIDYTWIQKDTKITVTPEILLEILPKASSEIDTTLVYRMIIPLYMVIALTQFITYLMIFIVGEKEKKIKEGMKIMGLKDPVYWLSWFIFYGIFVVILSTVSTLVLYFLNVFSNSNYFLIYILILLYGFSVIMFGFMVTPFFDKARTAGVVSNFSLVIVSLLYYITVFAKNGTIAALLSLISPVGFTIGFDKVLQMDLRDEEGLSFSNSFSGEGLPFGGSILMLIFDIVLYGFIGYYLDSVVPSEHGVKRSPFFCFSPSFWCSKTNKKSNKAQNQNVSENVEMVARDMQGKEAIQINNLYKSFKKNKKETVDAISGIDLTIYEGQITAIIGHNGAGKTTLFNILTGLTAPTSGTASIFGYDVSNLNDLEKIRSMTGVCPQHDILFENLTPKEHLEFFAAIKGIKDVKSAVSQTLAAIDLVDKTDTQSKHLSGGQKRKLSIGIALIGDPKIIILDEPTAGVDPYSRRHVWSLLQRIRKGKVILLTTHFMDEADILGDRKAVVLKGKICCCGSSLFLKNKFGVGYHLTLVLKEDLTTSTEITELVKSHVQHGELARRHGKELSYILPYKSVGKFADLFSAIENEINGGSKLGISSYGVSMTTLEEVFLQLQKNDEQPEEQTDELYNISNKLIMDKIRRNAQTKEIGYRPLDEDVTQSTENVSAMNLESLESIKCQPNTGQTLRALLKLRVIRLKREVKNLLLLIFVPIILSALGLYLNDISADTSPTTTYPFTLNLAHMYSYAPITIHNETGADLDNFAAQLKKSGVEYLDYTWNGNFSFLLDIYPHFGALDVRSIDTKKPSISVLYNDTQRHSLPILVNLINNAMYGLLGKSKDANIEVSSFPFVEISDSANTTAFGSGSLIIGMVFLYAPVLLAIDMVYDREIKARNQLRVNGLKFSLYFISFFIIQIAIMTFICGILIALISAMHTESMSSSPAITMLVILIGLYCPASILFTTCFSYAFDKTRSAQSALPNVAFLLGFVPFLVILLTSQLGDSLGTFLHSLFSFTDVMYIPFGIIYFIQTASVNCRNDEDCQGELGDYFTTELIVILIALLIHIPLWYFMVLLADIRKGGGRFMDIFKKSAKGVLQGDNEISDVGQNEDQDVRMERQKVQSLISNPSATPPVVLVDRLRKEFPSSITKSRCCCRGKKANSNKVAVQSLSLAVQAGEVFGLLGHNGAGKTTALRIMTAEESPTRGRIQLCGNSITSNLNAAFQLLGYCPQHDAQWKNITIKEHLEIYAAIRGVPSKDIPRVVNLYLRGLQIHEHKDKQSEKCSGGTRRKLSYAIAMVGNPKIVLLDEPSTGMDPQSKRFLWDTVLSSFRGSKGAILTTHSMEEADVLCSRVAIMVKGQLRCIGSTQYLKNLYGAGYHLEIKLSVEETEKLETCKKFVNSQFPNAILEESVSNRLIFSIPQNNVPSLANCFRSLEEAKSKLSIEEYSLNQTTLEQVFLKFAHENEVED